MKPLSLCTRIKNIHAKTVSIAAARLYDCYITLLSNAHHFQHWVHSHNLGSRAERIDCEINIPEPVFWGRGDLSGYLRIINCILTHTYIERNRERRKTELLCFAFVLAVTTNEPIYSVWKTEVEGEGTLSLSQQAFADKVHSGALVFKPICLLSSVKA